MTLPEALRQVREALERSGIPAMLIGGLANLRWGEPRSTLDIDLTLDADDQGIVRFAEGVGTILVDDPQGFLSRARVLPVRLPDGTRLDLIAATLAFERDAIRRAVPAEIDGVVLPTCTAEDLILHKIVSERERDLSDVEGILRRQGGAIDVEGLRDVVAAMAADLDDPALLARFDEAARRANG